MPGRLIQDAEAGVLFAPFGLAANDQRFGDFRPRFNAAPGQKVPVICRKGGGQTALEFMLWGMSSRSGPGGPQPFARCEGIAEGRTSAGLRCIVPITGWYEWVGERSPKRIYCVRPSDGATLALAAIYADEPGGAEFSVVTCEPNADIAPLHHRMGVFLEAAGRDAWLDPATPADALSPLLQPYPAGRFRHFEVGPWVSKATNEGPRCIEPIKTGKDLFR